MLSCIGLVFVSAASAERAEIVYAGQGGNAAAREAATLGASSLSGGGENSYGYGATARERRGGVIDLRRSAAPRTQEMRLEETAAPAPVARPDAEPAAEGAPNWVERERVGPPYEANGRWYVPTPEPGYEQTGTASWYGAQFHGQRTASGEIFDQEMLTAAHPTLPIPSLVQVTNLENGREVIVRVNDRGPFVGERLIDVSRRSAEVLGFEAAGHARVHVRYLGPAPRRVNADGAPSPASPPSLAPVPQQPEGMAEQGPVSLLPAPAPETSLAGAPEDAPVTSYNLAPAYAVAATGGYFVQVGAYSDVANAHRVRDAVAAAGPVVVDIRETATGTELFRVRVGPWATREAADDARRTLASLGHADAVLAAR